MLNVGQIRRPSISTFLTRNGLDYTVVERKRRNGSVTYKDTSLQTTTGLDSSQCYYVRARIEKKPSDNAPQNISIRLRYSDKTGGVDIDDTYQNLKSCRLSDFQTYQEVDFLFTPNANYNQVAFELIRTTDDYIVNGDGTQGRVVNLKNIEFYRVINIIDTLKQLYQTPPLESLKQIGVRSEPGLRLCINGEEVTVGPSGVYEVYNGMKIKYLGFIINDSSLTSDKKQDFILDFTY